MIGLCAPRDSHTTPRVFQPFYPLAGVIHSDIALNGGLPETVEVFTSSALESKNYLTLA